MPCFFPQETERFGRAGDAPFTGAPRWYLHQGAPEVARLWCADPSPEVSVCPNGGQLCQPGGRWLRGGFRKRCSPQVLLSGHPSPPSPDALEMGQGVAAGGVSGVAHPAPCEDSRSPAGWGAPSSALKRPRGCSKDSPALRVVPLGLPPAPRGGEGDTLRRTPSPKEGTHTHEDHPKHTSQPRTFPKTDPDPRGAKPRAPSLHPPEEGDRRGQSGGAVKVPAPL